MIMIRQWGLLTIQRLGDCVLYFDSKSFSHPFSFYFFIEIVNNGGTSVRDHSEQFLYFSFSLSSNFFNMGVGGGSSGASGASADDPGVLNW